MNIEMIKNELEKLNRDKANIDTRIVQLREELISTEKNRDVISGAIQTCAYFLKMQEDENLEKENKTTE
jgi:septal ring factor EnvC (AmiA/AmiB activator)